MYDTWYYHTSTHDTTVVLYCCTSTTIFYFRVCAVSICRYYHTPSSNVLLQVANVLLCTDCFRCTLLVVPSYRQSQSCCQRHGIIWSLSYCTKVLRIYLLNSVCEVWRPFNSPWAVSSADVYPAANQIFSDNVCPWCFVGKRNLESAMKQFSAAPSSGDAPTSSPVEFDVRWKPFFLNVESPETSEEPIKVCACSSWLRAVWENQYSYVVQLRAPSVTKLSTRYSKRVLVLIGQASGPRERSANMNACTGSYCTMILYQPSATVVLCRVKLKAGSHGQHGMLLLVLLRGSSLRVVYMLCNTARRRSVGGVVKTNAPNTAFYLRPCPFLQGAP